MVCPISQPSDLQLRSSSKPKNAYADVSSVAFGLRSYSPELGRWINRDPIGEDGGTNLAAFVGNDPRGKYDLLGQRDRTTGVMTCFRQFADAWAGPYGSGWHAYLQIGNNWSNYKTDFTIGWAGGNADAAYGEKNKDNPPPLVTLRFCNTTKKKRCGKLPDGVKCKDATTTQIHACIMDKGNYPEGTYHSYWRNCGDWVRIVAKKCCVKPNFSGPGGSGHMYYGPSFGWDKK